MTALNPDVNGRLTLTAFLRAHESIYLVITFMERKACLTSMFVCVCATVTSMAGCEVQHPLNTRRHKCILLLFVPGRDLHECRRIPESPERDETKSLILFSNQPIPSYPDGAANQERRLESQKMNRWKSALISDALAADEADGQ